jgi:hypothetical protein
MGHPMAGGQRTEAAAPAPTGPIAPSQTAIDAITALLGAMNANQLFDLMSQMKVWINIDFLES